MTNPKLRAISASEGPNARARCRPEESTVQAECCRRYSEPEASSRQRTVDTSLMSSVEQRKLLCAYNSQPATAAGCSQEVGLGRDTQACDHMSLPSPGDDNDDDGAEAGVHHEGEDTARRHLRDATPLQHQGC